VNLAGGQWDGPCRQFGEHAPILDRNVAGEVKQRHGNQKQKSERMVISWLSQDEQLRRGVSGPY